MGGSLVLSAKYRVNSIIIGVCLMSESGIISGQRELPTYTQVIIRTKNKAIIGGNAENPSLSDFTYYFVDNFADFIYGGIALNATVSRSIKKNKIYCSPDLNIIVATNNYDCYISTDGMATWSDVVVINSDWVAVANDGAMMAIVAGNVMTSVDFGATWINTGYSAASDCAFSIFNASNYAIWGISSDSYMIVCKRGANVQTFTTTYLPQLIVHFSETVLFLLSKNDNGFRLYKIDLIANTISSPYLINRYSDSVTMNLSDNKIFITMYSTVYNTYVYIFDVNLNLINSFDSGLKELAAIQHNFI